MLSESSEDLDRTFTALADPTRRAILRRLASGEATAGQLAEPFPISGPAISRHLRVLEEAGLITRQRDGQHQRCRLETAALAAATQWLDFYRRFWLGSFHQLAEHLAQDQSKELEKPRRREDAKEDAKKTKRRSRGGDRR